MEPGTVVENVCATPDMEGLDSEGIEAVRAEIVRVFGRYPGTPHGWPTSAPLLDSPPIIRPLDDNQPVWHYVGAKEYAS